MKLRKYAALNIGLFAFISLNPYIRWILPNELFYGLFLVSTFLLTIIIKSRTRGAIITSIPRIRIALLLIIFIIYYTTPVIHEFRWGHLLWHLPFLLIIFYNDDIIGEGYNILRKIMLWVTIFALFFWILNLINFPLPYFKYMPDFRYNPLDYYRIYGPAISLYRGNLAVGEFYGFERITGVFAEPGHYGIYLGLILAIENFNFSIRKNRLFLIAGILTFSIAFYGIFLVGFMYRLIRDKRLSKNILYPLIIISLISGFGMLGSSEGFRELTIGRAFGDKDAQSINPSTIIDSRISEGFITNFETFVHSSKFYTGWGIRDEGGAFSTNWRGLIFRFGLIGLLIIVIFIIAITSQTSLLHNILLVSISMLILAHRSYLFYTPSIYLLLYMSVTVYMRSKYLNKQANC